MTASEPATPPGPAPRGPNWWLHFLAWAVVLSVPCWLLAGAYHAGLRAATSFLLSVTLPPVGGIEVDATQALGIFTAMCLASVRAPMGRRLVAIAIGLPILMALELSTGIIAIGTEALASSGVVPTSVLRFEDQVLIAPPWLGAPLLWLLLLGRWEFPMARQQDKAAGESGAAGTSTPPRGRGNAKRAVELRPR